MVLRVGVVACLLAGCGLTMTRGPDPNRPPHVRPSCTETMDAPKRDGAGAAVGLLLIVVGGVGLEVDSADHDVAAAILVGGVVTMAASYLSGGVGYYRVKRCRRAIADFERTQGPGMPPVPR